MNNTDWRINVLSGLAENIGAPLFEVLMLIKQYQKNEDILDTLYSTNKTVEEAIKQLMVIQPKFQVRGIFTVKSKSGINDTILSFCIDLDLSFYEGKDLINDGRNDVSDINLSEIITNTIDKDDIGINKKDIVIVTMDIWCNRFDKGWFVIK